MHRCAGAGAGLSGSGHLVLLILAIWRHDAEIPRSLRVIAFIVVTLFAVGMGREWVQALYRRCTGAVRRAKHQGGPPARQWFVYLAWGVHSPAGCRKLAWDNRRPFVHAFTKFAGVWAEFNATY